MYGHPLYGRIASCYCRIWYPNAFYVITQVVGVTNLKWVKNELLIDESDLQGICRVQNREAQLVRQQLIANN